MSTNTPTDKRPYGWLGFEPEPDTTGDGSGDPDKHFLTIGIWSGGSFEEEVAVIVHRTCHGEYPIDGAVAQQKELVAQHIVKLLNDNPIDFDVISSGIDWGRARRAGAIT